MVVDSGNMRITAYKELFNILFKRIAYKDITINGIRVRIMGLHLMDYGLNWNEKSHKHSFFEIHYVTEEQVYTTINKTEYLISQKHFYIVPPETYHSHRQDPGTGHIGFAVRWEFALEQKDAIPGNTSAELEKACAAMSRAQSNPIMDTGSVIKALIQLLAMAEAGGSVMELQLAFCRLILIIAGYYTEKASIPSMEDSDLYMGNPIVEKAIRFIEDNYINIDVQGVSRYASISYSHLARLFKRCTGETVSHHINKIRLKKAQKQLISSNMSLECIASDVGFSSVTYFCTIFKKTYGISPNSFRKGKKRLSE